MKQKYTYDYCKSVSENCKSIFDLRSKDLTCYKTIKRNKWDQLTFHFEKSIIPKSNAGGDKKKVKDGTYTKKYLTELFSKYNSIKDLRAEQNGAYLTAIKNKWLVECLPFHIRKISSFSKEECKVVYLKYNTLTELKNSSDSRIIHWVRKNNWTEGLSNHFVKNKSYTFEYGLSEFKKYNTRKELRSNDRALWSWGQRIGKLDELCCHMHKLRKDNGSITKSFLKKYYSKFDERTAAIESNLSYYTILLRNDWKDLLEGLPDRKYSAPEKEIYLIILSIYKNAVNNKRWGKLKKGVYGQRFELDIFIPELNKGVEFNGTYWHSYEGLRKSRKNWPDHMIQNYHEIKRQFFADRNISYVEISESEWDQNPEDCIQKALNFLKS